MQLFTNNASTTLAEGIDEEATTITVETGQGALFATFVNAGDFQMVTLDDGENIEILKVTGRTDDELTVVRAQEGTVAQSWAAGTTIEARLTKGTLERALLGLDFGSGALGLHAINIQTGRVNANSLASGEYSIAIGHNSAAQAVNSIALGRWCGSFAQQGTVVGFNSYANGEGGTALGASASADQHAICVGAGGNGSSASYDFCIAIGFEAQAGDMDAMSMGHSAEAWSAGAIAFGKEARTDGENSISIGNLAKNMSSSGRTANKAISLGEVRQQASSNYNLHRCIKAGTTGSSNPAWTTNLHGLTVDGTVIWEMIAKLTTAPDRNNCISLGKEAYTHTGGAIAFGHKSRSIEAGMAIGQEAFGGFQGVAIGYQAKSVSSRSVGLGYQSLAGSPPLWEAGVSRTVGDTIRTTAGTVHRLIATSNDGAMVSTGSEPSWTTTQGLTTGETGESSVTGTWVMVGSLVVSENDGQVAIGYGSIAASEFSLAMGVMALAAEEYAVTYGYATIGAANSVAVGANAQAINAESIAIGSGSKVSAVAGEGSSGIAIGSGAESLGDGKSTAIGDHSVNRIDDTAVIGGMLLVRKDDGELEAEAHYHFTAGVNVVLSKEIDLTALGEDVAEITIPTGASFYIDEIGLIVTETDTVSAQPSVSFGDGSDPDAVLVATPTTKNAVKGRDIFTPLNKDGLSVLAASVTTAATATALKGRFYWKGILVEYQ